MRAVVVETLSFCKQFEFSYAYHHPSPRFPVLTVFSDIWAETSLSLYQGASLMFWLMGRKISRLKTSLKSLYGRIIHCENFSLKSISHSLILCLYNVEEGVSADVSAWQCGTWNYIADLNQCLRCNWGELTHITWKNHRLLDELPTAMAWTGRASGANVLSLLKWVANGFDFDFILSFVSMHMTFLSHKSQRSSKIALCPIDCPADLLFKEVVQFHYFESTNPGCAEDLSFVACLRPFLVASGAQQLVIQRIYSICYFESTISGHAEFLWLCPLSLF